MAKAYVIAFYREVKDADRLAAYAPLATKAIAEAGGRILVRGGRVKALESGTEERTVVIEFDSYEAACTYYDGDAYQAALEALGEGAVVREIRAVEGVD
mgnify:CR=1 FL=1|jgi:uncharacterized protein (DUF1330 family)